MLSLVLPTYNEAQNLPSLVDFLDGVLSTIAHEIIIVDDNSPDGTWRVAQNLAERFSSVRVMRRIGTRGLSSAVIDGFDAAHGDILAVMDADGQHDSALLLKLLGAIDAGAGVAIGSRYAPGGSVGDWVTDRRIISTIGTFLSRRLSNVQVSDPLGGFFMMRTQLFKSIRPHIHPSGFKILLEVLAHIPPSTPVAEVPLIFRSRLHGESKLSLAVHLAFCAQILRLALIRFYRLLRHSSALLFMMISTLLILVLVPRAFLLRTLFLNTSVRSTVSTALREIADHQGWLLSDITLLSVTPDTVTLTHRPHLRVPTPTTFCTMTLSTTSLTCTDD